MIPKINYGKYSKPANTSPQSGAISSPSPSSSTLSHKITKSPVNVNNTLQIFSNPQVTSLPITRENTIPKSFIEKLKELFKDSEVEQKRLKIQAGFCLLDGTSLLNNHSDHLLMILSKHENQDIADQLNTIASSTSYAGQRDRQLQDIGYYLSLLPLEGNIGEKLNKLFVQINEISVFLATEKPAKWHNELKKIDALISIGITHQNELPHVRSRLHDVRSFKIDDKAFAHIHAESIIKGSRLEGYSSTAMISLFKSYLTLNSEHYKDISNFKSLFKMFTDAEVLNLASNTNIWLDQGVTHLPVQFKERFDNFSSTLKLIIKALRPGEKTMMDAGWVGTPSGHSMKVTIEKEKEGTLLLTVFNAGAGIGEYHVWLNDGENKLVQPFVEISGIEIDRFLDAKSIQAFLEFRLLERNTANIKTMLTEYGAKDVYAFFLNCLGGEVLPCRGDREKFVPSQVSGTCTWASILALIHTELSPKDYYRILSDISFDILCINFQQNQNTLATNDEARILLEHGLINMAQLACDAYQNEAISIARMLEINATLKELRSSLESAENDGQASAIFTSELVFENFSANDTQKKSHEMTLRKLEPMLPDSETVSRLYLKSNSKAKLSFYWLNNKDALLAGLKLFSEGIREYINSGNSAEGIYQLEQFFVLQATEKRDTIWNEIPLVDIPKTIVALADLSEILCDAQKHHPHRINSYTVYSHYLAAKSLELAQKLPDLTYNSKTMKIDTISSGYKRVFGYGIGLGDIVIQTFQDSNLYSSEDRFLREVTIDIFNHFSKEKNASCSIASVENLFMEIIGKIKIPTIPIESEYEQYELKFIDKYLKQKSLNPKNLTRNEAVAEAFCDWYGDQMPAHFCAIRRQLLIAMSFQYKKPLKPTRGRLINTTYDINFNIFLKNECFTQVEENWLDSKLSKIFSVRKENTNKQPSETDIMVGEYEEWEKNLRLMVNEWGGSRNEKYREQQILKCLAYFSDHLKTLSDPNRRLILRQLIFESNYLEVLLDYNPYFGEQLLQFAENGEKLFQERNDIAAVAFFIELGRDVDNLLSLEGLKNELIDYRGRILTVLGIESNQPLANCQPAPNLSAQKLTYLYAQLAASYQSHPPKNFTVKDAILFLTAMMHNNFHPLPIHAKSDRLCDQMHSASQRWKLKIQELLLSDSGSFICGKILNSLIPEAGFQHFHCSQYPLCVTSDNEYSLNAQSFEIFKNNQVLTGLPQKILQDKQFKKFFKNEKYQCSKINTNCYQFTDERGNLIQILTEDSYKNKIRQNILGRWYEMASPVEGSNLTYYMPEDLHLISSVQGVWFPLIVEDKSIAIICNDDLSIAYFIHLLKSKIENEKTYYSVDKVRKICPKDLPLYLVDLKGIKNKALEKLFTTAMLWSDQNGILKALEIPSLELSFNFSVDKTGYRAECNEHPGFFISQNQTYRGIRYIPRSIVLENEKGQRKLALPYGIVSAVTRGIIQQGALSTHIEIKSSRSIIIDLDKTSNLIAKDREQKLYLANLLFVQKKYQSAQQMIRQSQSLIIPFNEQERELLTWIIINQNQDVSPHGLAVALSALALLPIDSSVGGSAKEIKQAFTIINELKRLKSEYSKFSGSRFIIPHLNLTAKERLSIFKKIPELSKTDQISREEIQFPPVKKISKKLPFHFEYVFASKSQLNEDQKKLDRFIITRHIETQLIQWLEYAKGDPLKLELILIGVEHNPKIPAEVSVLLRSVGLGFKCNLDNLRQIQAQKDRRAFLELISEAQKFLNRHQRVEEYGKGDVSLKGNRVKRSSRGINKQTITVANEKTEYHLPFPLTPRQPVLPNKILEEIFTPKPNSGLRLSLDEIDSLNKVVLTDNNPENVALAEHIAGYWSQDLHGKKHHYLKPEMQEKALGLLKIQSAELSKQVNVQEKELLVFANALPTTPQDGLILHLEKISQIRQEITVRDLILFTARSRHFCLEGKNPYLKGKEKELLDRCLKFLDLKAQQQQTERAILMLNKLKFLDNTSCTYSQLSETLFAEITRQCPYKPEHNPELLVFEVVEEIGLHDWQVKDLERLLNPKLNENRNVILEKVMGSGKTKVYLSLLALGKADGDHLSIVVVHSSQLEGVGKAMQIQGGQLFGQVAHPFNFSRDTDTSLPALEKLFLECQEVRTNRHFYVATDKAIHSLGLAFDEMWQSFLASPEDNPHLEARLEKMRDIINLIRIKGKATLDEADLLLNCRYEVIYALGEAQPLANDHAAFVADLYQAIFPILAKLQTFTHEGYGEIKPHLIDTFTREVAVKIIPDCKVDLVISYLKGEKAGADYVSSLSNKERHLMAIAFYEFKELLPIVLEKRCGEHYGYSDNIKKVLPVPYVASGIPSATSEFSFPYAQLNYTMQTLIHEGITPRILKSVISELQISAEYERQLSVGMSLKETNGYKEFLNICGNTLNIPFLDCTDEDLDALAAEYKQDHNKIYPFAKKYLFPEVKLHELKLSSTPFSLYNMFLEVQGFTGTPYNSATYPLGIETIRDPNSAGKTQGIIWKNSKKVHKLASVAFDDVIAEVGALIGVGGYGAFIDVGALFNGIDNQRVAENILSYLPKEIYRGVLFYKDNHPYVIESGKKDLIAYEKYDSTHSLFILYDQYHTTGTDFVIQGKSLLSFGKNTSMRDLEQGYMRDRQAAIGERVEFILSVESEAFCRSSVKLDLNAAVDTASIVRVANLNQDAELKMQKLMATFGRLKETIHQQVRSWQCDYQLSPKTIKQYAKQIDPLIVDRVKDAPWEQFGIYQEDVGVDVFFTNIINQMCEKFNPLLEIFFPYNPFFAKASFKQNLMKCVNFNILPKKISAAAQSGPEQLVEQQSISQVQNEQTSLVQREQLRDANENSDSGQLLYWNWKRDTGYSAAFLENSFTRQQFLDVILKSPKGFLPYVSQNQVPFLQLDSFLDSNLSDLVNIFDIEVSYNFHPFLGLRLKGSDSTVGEISLFEKGQIDVQNMLLCTNRKTGKRQLRLISRADAGFFFDQLSVEKESNRQIESKNENENENEIEITLYNLSLGVIQSNSKHIQSGFKTPVNSIFLQKIVQAKFFNGESFYTPMEFTALQKWIKEKGAAKMEKLFVNHILENKKLKARSFYGSPLALFFRACHEL